MPSAATRVRLEIIVPSEVRERDKYHDTAYMCDLHYGTNVPIQETERESQGAQMCGCRAGGGGRGMDWEFGISTSKLFHLEWIKNKVQLYSTGNYIQSL